MKIPRDLDGAELARRLARFGYAVTRQSGSHMRLTRVLPNGQQHLTIPAHKPLRVGTLRQILMDVANQVGTNLEALIQALDA